VEARRKNKSLNSYILERLTADTMEAGRKAG
jgi:hypothetical protein